MFRFTTGGGAVSFTLNVSQYGPNLDGVLDLLNSQGQTITTASPGGSLGASLSQTLGSGTYFVVARSSGGYGNLGQYTLTGSVPGVSQTPQIGVAVSGTDIADGGTLSFGSTAVGSAVTRTVTVRNAGSGTLNLTPLDGVTLPAGFTLLSNLGSTSLAAGQSTTFSIRLDGSATGSFGGTISLAHSADGGSFEVALAGTVTTAPQVAFVKIIDNGASGFTTSGSWSRQSGMGRDGDVHTAAKGNGTAVATWSFTGLAAGQYRVSVTWPKNGGYASNAPFTVYNGTSSLGTTRVNERVNPSGLSANSSNWRNLGTFTITGDRLVVKLTNGADNRVAADAVRIERIYPTSGAALTGSSLGSNSAAAVVGWMTSRGAGGVEASRTPVAAGTETGHVMPTSNLAGGVVWQHEVVFSEQGDLDPELTALRQTRELLDELAAHGLGSSELASAIDHLLAEPC